MPPMIDLVDSLSSSIAWLAFEMLTSRSWSCENISFNSESKLEVLGGKPVTRTRALELNDGDTPEISKVP
jgi:hypothetical protein